MRSQFRFVAISAVVGVLFGARTNRLNDDYEQLAAAYAGDGDGTMVTPDQYAEVRSARNDAQSAQRVTNICLFSSAALAAGAVTLIFFTDWGGDEAAPSTSHRTTRSRGRRRAST